MNKIIPITPMSAFSLNTNKTNRFLDDPSRRRWF